MAVVSCHERGDCNLYQNRLIIAAWAPYFDDMDAIIFLAPIRWVCIDVLKYCHPYAINSHRIAASIRSLKRIPESTDRCATLLSPILAGVMRDQTVFDF